MAYQARPRESNACAFRLRGFIGASALGIGLLAPLGGAVSAATTSAPPISIDGSHTSVAALEHNDVVLVPARGFFERLGATVTSTPASFVATRDGKKLAVLAVGSRVATINGEARTLPFAPFVSAGNVMIPLRLVSEAAGAAVAYSSSPHSVNVTRAAAATGVAAAGAAAAGAGAAAVSQAAAPVAAPAATEVASATPVADTQTNESGIPWWVWALLALVLLALIVWAVTRRKREPIITTSSTARNKEPIITTTSKHNDPTITTRK